DSTGVEVSAHRTLLGTLSFRRRQTPKSGRSSLKGCQARGCQVFAVWVKQRFSCCCSTFVPCKGPTQARAFRDHLNRARLCFLVGQGAPNVTWPVARAAFWAQTSLHTLAASPLQKFESR